MKRIIILVIGIFMSQSIVASTMSHKLKPDIYFLGGGVFNAKQGKEQHINITGLIGDQYLVLSDKSTSGLISLGTLWKIKSFKPGIFMMGLDYSYYGNTKTKGDILLENSLRNLSYSYTSHSSTFILSAQFLHPLRRSGYETSFEVGIGPNFMTTQNYSEQSLDGITATSNTFKGKTTTSFAARAGFSVLVTNLSKTKSLSLGYRLTLLGSGELTPNFTAIRNTLSTGTVYNQAILLSLYV